MMLNGKGSLTGCGLYGYSLVSHLFNRVLQYSCLFLNGIVLLSYTSCPWLINASFFKFGP